MGYWLSARLSERGSFPLDRNVETIQIMSLKIKRDGRVTVELIRYLGVPWQIEVFSVWTSKAMATEEGGRDNPPRKAFLSETEVFFSYL